MSSEAFQNLPVTESNLPAAADVTFEKLDEGYLKAVLLSQLLFWLLLCLAGHVVYFFVQKAIAVVDLPITGPVALAILIVMVGITIPMVKAYGLALRDHDIHLKSGVIWRKVTSLPFNRIQHVELESGPLDRLFHLATLKIYTAGGYSADMRIPGLGFQRASKLRSAILEKAGIKDTGTDEHA